MLRKVIFSVLALLVAWALGNVLYETWMQGHVYDTSSRTHITHDHSYTSNRFGFYAAFSFQVFMSFTAVVLLLGLGWMKKDSGSIWKSSSRGSVGTGFSTADIPLKVRLRWAGVGFLALLALTAYSVLLLYFHRIAIPAALWVCLVVLSLATALIFRALLRQSKSAG